MLLIHELRKEEIQNKLIEISMEMKELAMDLDEEQQTELRKIALKLYAMADVE